MNNATLQRLRAAGVACPVIAMYNAHLKVVSRLTIIACYRTERGTRGKIRIIDFRDLRVLKNKQLC